MKKRVGSRPQQGDDGVEPLDTGGHDKLILMDYFLNPEFRAEVRHALNRGEAMHTLQRAIHDGQIPNDLAKRDDSLLGVSSALSLLSNIVVAWNTEGMQAALDGIRAAGVEPPSQDLRRVAPTNLEGINLRGTLDFPVEKYAEHCRRCAVGCAEIWVKTIRIPRLRELHPARMTISVVLSRPFGALNAKQARTWESQSRRRLPAPPSWRGRRAISKSMPELGARCLCVSA